MASRATPGVQKTREKCKKHVFWRLVLELQVFTGLRSTKYVSMNEQVAIFMYICVLGNTNRQTQEE
ncbi:hypothetical protein BJV74DRAFT_863976 [Russula compacta]|nr:hypothetical protein BJV74DRAFT_863976 [Russula compacta]